MPAGRPTTNPKPASIPYRKLRTFAQHLARICCDLDLVDHDIDCVFSPRERTEYATVTARTGRDTAGRGGEGIIPVPMLKGEFAGKGTKKKMGRPPGPSPRQRRSDGRKRA